MADEKISELGAASTLDGTELMELVQGGVNVQSTVGGVGAQATFSFAKQTDATPFTNPGLFDPASTVPSDGGWIAYDWGSADGTARTYYAQGSGSDGDLLIGVNSDGSLGFDIIETSGGYEVFAQVTPGASGGAVFFVAGRTGQTDDMVDLAGKFKVDGDRKISFFNETTVAQQGPISHCDTGDLGDVGDTLNNLLDAIKAYGLLS